MMQAAVFNGPRDIRIESVPIPVPEPNEILIRLDGCGVCASNLPVWEGRPWFEYPMAPGVPGHEGWGKVAAVGEKVEGVFPGERVAALASHAYAEYVIAKPEETVVLPRCLDSLPFPGEPLGCVMNIFNRSDIQPGQWVGIVGIGFLGALLTSLASRRGARVIAISRRPYALQIAARFGAETVLSGSSPEVLEAVKTWTSGKLCPRVIEATGYQEPLDLAAELTGERGRLIIAGYHQESPRQVDMQLWNWRGLDVINAHERDIHVYISGIREAVKKTAVDRFDPFPLFTHMFDLARIDEAFQLLHDRPTGFMKALLTLQ